MTAPLREGGFGSLPDEVILDKLEKLDERLRCVEKELASLKVWYSVLSFIIPSVLLAVILRGLRLQ
jgi:hypothetical protein